MGVRFGQPVPGSLLLHFLSPWPSNPAVLRSLLPSIGFPFALNIVSNPDSATPTVMRLPGFDARENDPKVEVHAGLVYAPDGKTLYVATGNSGKIAIYSTADWHKLGEILLDATVGQNSFTGSFAASVLVSPDGHTLFALDQGNWRIVIVDVSSQKVIASMPTGATPYAIALAPDCRRLLRHQYRTLRVLHRTRTQKRG